VLVDKGVPNTFRINHHYRALFAAIKTARFIHAYFAMAVHVERFESLFCIFLYACRTAIMTAGTAVLALINADKYMVLIVGLLTHDVKAFELS
jgi:hypothetical protein